MSQITQIQSWKSVKNLVPLPYRRISVQHYDGPMTVDAITTLLLSREAYRRTDFIVLRGEGTETAVVAITRAQSEPLFSQITSVEVMAFPDTCVYAKCPDVDPANRSALAEKVYELGIGPEGTLIVEGLYDHVNFIHHPNPLVVRVVEVAPPERHDWTMIGCERSLQFHRHFYGDEPPRVEMCPRHIAGERKEPTLLKCCLLETHIEQDKNIMVVPWGSDLAMVEAALRKLSEEVIYA